METAEPSKILDYAAITVGLTGTVLNLLLLWALDKNRSLNKKAVVIYQNLAAVDTFNCMMIPLCYLTVKQNGYHFTNKDAKSGILYLLIGGSINIPYMMLILLALCRIMLFRHQILHHKVKLNHVKCLCMTCWLVAIGSGAGIWMCYLLNGDLDAGALIGLLKFESVLTNTLIIVAFILLLLCVVFTRGLLRALESDQEAGKGKISVNCQDFPPSSTKDREVEPILKTNISVELKSVRTSFILFFSSITVFSAFPFAFSTAFVACGPFYNSTTMYCELLQNKVLSDPKHSYAAMQVSLCGMSIANAIILLRQKSFKVVLRYLVSSISRFFNRNKVDESAQQGVQVIVCNDGLANCFTTKKDITTEMSD